MSSSSSSEDESSELPSFGVNVGPDVPSPPSSSTNTASSLTDESRTAQRVLKEEGGIGFELGLRSAPAKEKTPKLREIKLLVCGGDRVGKSTIISQFVRKKISSEFNIGVTSWKKKVLVKGQPFMIDLREFAVPSQFASGVSINDIKRAHGYVLVYNIASRESLSDALRMHELIMRVRNNSSIKSTADVGIAPSDKKDEEIPPLILVGNFLDKEKSRQVLTLEGRDLADSFGCPFFEMTATTRPVVEMAVMEAFNMVQAFKRDARLTSGDFYRKNSGAGVDAALYSSGASAKPKDIEWGKPADVMGPSQAQVVKSATLPKLVEALTDPGYVDPDFADEVILTMSTFITPDEFLDLLIERYENAPALEGMTTKLAAATARQGHIRVRVYEFIQTWLVDWGHFLHSEHPGTLTKLISWIEKGGMSDTPFKALLEAANKAGEPVVTRTGPYVPIWKQIVGRGMPRPLMPKQHANGDVRFIDMSPLEIARQMTIIEYSLYRSIRVSELLLQRWSRGQKEVLAPNIVKGTRRFNAVSRWVATSIVKLRAIASRVFLITRFIEIAVHLRKLQNYSGVMQVMAGLQNSGVHRLKQTWRFIPNKYLKLFSELKRLTSTRSNFQEYRKELRNLTPPCVPYLGVFLSDLTFIEDGNKNEIRGLINFEKRRRAATVLKEILRFQSTEYLLMPVPVIGEYLLRIGGLDDDELYRLSVAHEPRVQKSRGSGGYSGASRGTKQGVQFKGRIPSSADRLPLPQFKSPAGPKSDKSATSATSTTSRVVEPSKVHAAVVKRNPDIEVDTVDPTSDGESLETDNGVNSAMSEAGLVLAQLDLSRREAAKTDNDDNVSVSDAGAKPGGSSEDLSSGGTEPVLAAAEAEAKAKGIPLLGDIGKATSVSSVASLPPDPPPAPSADNPETGGGLVFAPEGLQQAIAEALAKSDDEGDDVDAASDGGQSTGPVTPEVNVAAVLEATKAALAKTDRPLPPTPPTASTDGGDEATPKTGSTGPAAGRRLTRKKSRKSPGKLRPTPPVPPNDGSESGASGGSSKSGDPEDGGKTAKQLEDVAQNTKGDLRFELWVNWMGQMAASDAAYFYGSESPDTAPTDFHTVFMRSRALEITLQSVTEEFPSTQEGVDKLSALLEATMTVSPDYVTDLVEGLRSLSSVKLNENWARIVARGMAVFKAHPVNRRNATQLRTLSGLIAGLETSLSQMEAREGAHSVGLNRDRLEATSQLVKLYSTKKRLLNECTPMPDMTRRINTYKRGLWRTLEKNIQSQVKAEVNAAKSLAVNSSATAARRRSSEGKRTSTGKKPGNRFSRLTAKAKDNTAGLVRDFLKLMKADFKARSKKDSRAFKGLMGAVQVTYQNSLKWHLRIMDEQMSLLRRRINKVIRFRGEDPGSGKKMPSHLAPKVLEKLEAIYKEDVSELRKLIGFIDSIESRVEGLGNPEKVPVAKELLGKIRGLRVVQAELEESTHIDDMESTGTLGSVETLDDSENIAPSAF